LKTLPEKLVAAIILTFGVYVFLFLTRVAGIDFLSDFLFSEIGVLVTFNLVFVETYFLTME
jgi:hypothetical protein